MKLTRQQKYITLLETDLSFSRNEQLKYSKGSDKYNFYTEHIAYLEGEIAKHT